MSTAKQQRKHAAERKKRESAKGMVRRKTNSAVSVGRFQIHSLLGSGGMCDVYACTDIRRAEWSDTAPQVAVKRLLPVLASNRHAQIALAKEFFTLRHLTHPGIVRAFDLHEEPWGLCFSMELLDGPSVYEILGREPQGLGQDCIPMAVRLFEALVYLHGLGVVHADVKPTNLFLVREGRLVLIDFNVSQVSAKPGAACSPVAQGLRAKLHFSAHSLLHASPERIQSGRPSMADDVFSACCTIYELMEGAHPFGGKSALEAMEKNMRPAKPMGISTARWKLLRRGLSFEPGERPNAEQLWKGFSAAGFLRGLTL